MKQALKSSVLYMWLGNIGLALLIAWYFMGFPAGVLMLVGGVALFNYTIQILLEVREKRENVKSL